MKWFLFLVILIGGYFAMLFHASDIALNQVKELNKTYEYVADNPEKVATGQSYSE